jgi:outer membrane murein-binding lipoprotein Lpp
MKKIALLAVAALMLSGCSSTVTVEPAADANNPKCAEVIVRLPSDVEGMPKRVTGAQSTAAWGEPTHVLLRCGLDPVYSSKLQCVTQAGIDWLIDDSKAPSYRFITFGRKPAAEVIMDSRVISGAAVLDAMAPSVQYLPSTRTCG